MPDPIMRHFAYSHLPPHLRTVSERIALVAQDFDATLPDCAEKSAGLRKLLEAKDCFVRAELERPVEPTSSGIAHTELNKDFKDPRSEIEKIGDRLGMGDLTERN